jgi:OmcA/MtrC family decaheme c-type cytochrome
MQGTVDMMYIMHAIHGVGEKRDRFDRRRPHGYERVTYPNTILDCTACHIDGTQNFPVDPSKRLGVIEDGFGVVGVDVGINSPTGSVCYSCHQDTSDEYFNAVLKAHITLTGGEMYGNDANFDSYENGTRGETCILCHKP